MITSSLHFVGKTPTIFAVQKSGLPTRNSKQFAEVLFETLLLHFKQMETQPMLLLFFTEEEVEWMSRMGENIIPPAETTCKCPSYEVTLAAFLEHVLPYVNKLLGAEYIAVRRVNMEKIRAGECTEALKGLGKICIAVNCPFLAGNCLFPVFEKK